MKSCEWLKRNLPSIPDNSDPWTRKLQGTYVGDTVRENFYRLDDLSVTMLKSYVEPLLTLFQF